MTKRKNTVPPEVFAEKFPDTAAAINRMVIAGVSLKDIVQLADCGWFIGTQPTVYYMHALESYAQAAVRATEKP